MPEGAVPLRQAGVLDGAERREGTRVARSPELLSVVPQQLPVRGQLVVLGELPPRQRRDLAEHVLVGARQVALLALVAQVGARRQLAGRDAQREGDLVGHEARANGEAVVGLVGPGGVRAQALVAPHVQVAGRVLRPGARGVGLRERVRHDGARLAVEALLGLAPGQPQPLARLRAEAGALLAARPVAARQPAAGVEHAVAAAVGLVGEQGRGHGGGGQRDVRVQSARLACGGEACQRADGLGDAPARRVGHGEQARERRHALRAARGGAGGGGGEREPALRDVAQVVAAHGADARVVGRLLRAVDRVVEGAPLGAYAMRVLRPHRVARRLRAPVRQRGDVLEAEALLQQRGHVPQLPDLLHGPALVRERRGPGAQRRDDALLHVGVQLPARDARQPLDLGRGQQPAQPAGVRVLGGFAFPHRVSLRQIIPPGV